MCWLKELTLTVLMGMTGPASWVAIFSSSAWKDLKQLFKEREKKHITQLHLAKSQTNIRVSLTFWWVIQLKSGLVITNCWSILAYFLIFNHIQTTAMLMYVLISETVSHVWLSACIVHISVTLQVLSDVFLKSGGSSHQKYLANISQVNWFSKWIEFEKFTDGSAFS